MFVTIAAILILLVLLVVFFPWPESDVLFQDSEEGRIDERTIMFSRAELVPGTERFNAYYEEHPSHLGLDSEWRKSAGLLSDQSVFYHQLVFPAADAQFYSVSGLHERTDGVVSDEKSGISSEEMTRFLFRWAKELGCHSIGITPLQSSHLYSVGGRKHNYGESVVNEHSYAIAFTVEMDHARIQSAPKSAVILESSDKYLKAGAIAVSIAAFLRNLGYSARAHIDGHYQVRCPQVARDAGLGELSRMSLLITPKLGARVRIGVVTTDAPLLISQRKPDSSVIRFCEECRKCAVNCPSQAISHDSRQHVNGALQWNINQEKCFSYWCTAGTDCGRCIAVCPYSHPDNHFHRIVRFFIRTSPVFRRIAIRLDDAVYGRKPRSASLPGWMILKN